MRFLFPFSMLPKGCRVVLYGAGEVGYDFYRQLKTSGYAEVTLWVDRQYEWFRRLNLPVDEPKKLLEVDFDYVIITAENESVYASIRNDLICMGIDYGKLVWDSDYTVHENIVYGYADRDIEAEMKYADQTDPVRFLNKNRLDITIRYLYALEIMRDENGGNGEQLYNKFILCGCNAIEPTENYISAYFSEYSNKRGLKAFRESFKDLLESVNSNGFLKEQFLPVDSRGNLINGAHRVAAALACGKTVWYVQYPFDGLKYVCDENMLLGMGFTQDDIMCVLNCYESIVHKH